jgi:hypothetical protein
MGLETVWQQCVYNGNQLWTWLRYESGIHPLMFLGVVMVIVLAVILYKTEVRDK